jgi:hypothetical protein
MVHQLGYQKIIGSLLHLAQCTRPDIALPVGALAAYALAPSVAHFAALVKIVRYVGGSDGLPLVVVISLWIFDVMQILLLVRTPDAAPQPG